MTTSLALNGGKPCANTCTVYLPGTTGFTSKNPSRLVVAVLDAPSAGSTTTVAPATAAPEGSVTWPRSTPAGDCAIAPATKMSSTPRSDTISLALCLYNKFIPHPQTIRAADSLIAGRLAATQAPG